MAKTIATKQKMLATRAVKTSEMVLLRSGALPVYRISAKAVIDPSEFIPIVGERKPAGNVIKLLRRVDLFHRKASQLQYALAHFNFGETRLDIFSPEYGYYYPTGRRYFQFQRSQLAYTDSSAWSMELTVEKGYEPELRFILYPYDLANYAKIMLGKTTTGRPGERCVMTVNINNTEFNLDLSSRSYKYFDLFFNGNTFAGQDVKLALRLASNPQNQAICDIYQVQLYNTIYAPPPVGILES